MPALLAVPWLVPLLTGVTAAGTLGEGIYAATQSGGSSAPAGPTPDQTKQLDAQKLLAQQKAAFLNSQSGATAPPTGTSGLTGPSTTSGTPDVNALLKLLNPGSGDQNISGGSGQVITPGASNGLTSLSV